jgi:hypothetical protein
MFAIQPYLSFSNIVDTDHHRFDCKIGILFEQYFEAFERKIDDFDHMFEGQTYDLFQINIDALDVSNEFAIVAIVLFDICIVNLH